MTHNITLSYGKRPVRGIVDATGIWFAACDLFAALRLRTDRRLLACMSPEHLKLFSFPAGEGSLRLTAVSPLGAVTIAGHAPPPVNRMLDGWTRRETATLADEHGLPALGLTLCADDTLPAKPKALHDNFYPWHELKWANSHVRPRAPNLLEPALFDEDPSLPPHDPEGDAARLRAKFLGVDCEA